MGTTAFSFFSEYKIRQCKRIYERAGLGKFDNMHIVGKMVELDNVLTNILAVAVKDIELMLKAQLILVLGHSEYREKAHYHKESFDEKKRNKKEKKLKKKRWEYFEYKVEEITNKYGEKPLDEFMDSLDFLHYVNMFEMLGDDKQEIIAKDFNYSNDVASFITDINIINRVRNMCVHHNWDDFREDDFQYDKTYQIPLFQVIKIIDTMSENMCLPKWKPAFSYFIVSQMPDMPFARVRDIWTKMLEKIYGFPNFNAWQDDVIIGRILDYINQNIQGKKFKDIIKSLGKGVQQQIQDHQAPNLENIPEEFIECVGEQSELLANMMEKGATEEQINALCNELRAVVNKHNILFPAND